MCGRYTLRKLPAVEGIDVKPLLEPWRDLKRFNVAPTRKMPVLRMSGMPEAVELSWGIHPKWKTQSGRPLINARSETAAARPTFRESIARRRCLVPADGFYEWKRDSKPARPHFFCLKGEIPFWFAGIWEDEEYLILTTCPNELTRTIHDRMPVILAGEAASQWLGETPLFRDALSRLCRPFPAEKMECREVGLTVNNARNDGPECLNRADV